MQVLALVSWPSDLDQGGDAAAALLQDEVTGWLLELAHRAVARVAGLTQEIMLLLVSVATPT